MSRFVGLDPVSISALVAELERVAAALASLRGVVAAVAPSVDALQRVAPLTTVAGAAGEAAADLRKRAAVVSAGLPGGGLGPLPFPANRILGWSGISPGSTTERALEEEFLYQVRRQLSPAGWRRWFAARGSGPAHALARRLPHLVGPLDGAPPAARIAATRLLVGRELVALGSHLARLDALNREGRLPWLALIALRRTARRLRTRQAMLRRWLDERRKLLLFDPPREQMVEVFGDLASARRVAVVVPGVGTNLDNFEDLRTAVAELAEEAQRLATEPVAIVAWLGYDAPDNIVIDAAGSAAACSGADSLVGFLAGSVPEGATVTVIGHSYGSVVVGAALGAGVKATAVLLGSPGTAAPDAGALRSSARIWVGLADGDPIVLAPPAIHGPDPHEPSFGATRFATDGAVGHSLTEYLDEGTESLRNVASIVAGRVDEVTPWESTLLSRLFGAVALPLLPLVAPLRLGGLLLRGTSDGGCRHAKRQPQPLP